METDTLRAWLEVDYSLIPHNVKEIRRLMGSTPIMGIVKADSYGLGAVSCTKALQACGIHTFAVATIEEAIELRKAGIEDDILILGSTPEASFDKLAQYSLIQTILSLPYAKKMSAWGKEHGGTLRGHVKADTGMNRIGIQYQDDIKDYDAIKEAYELDNLKVEGIFSHFPVSDDLEEDSKAFTTHQMELFEELIARLKADGIDPGLRHIQNSYGILNYGDLGYDFCRPGLLYMGVTSDDAIPVVSDPDFKPIASLKAKVSMVKTISAGATVSYGRHYQADSPRRIASLTIGYADGLPRACSNKNLEVLIRGHRVPLAGNICMDQCMADVTGYDDIEAGDIVTLIGTDGNETVTVDEISRKAGTINNETLTRFTKRVPRLDVSDRQ